jgi:hypothetical protein
MEAAILQLALVFEELEHEAGPRINFSPLKELDSSLHYPVQLFITLEEGLADPRGFALDALNISNAGIAMPRSPSFPSQVPALNEF